MYILLAALSLYYAYQFSKTEADPDWSMFNLWAFTGARYGRDFADCKMPTIHLWYLAIAKVVGADVRRIKFTHHLLISLPGVIVGGWAGLAYIVVINSGVLLSFHGNVGQPAAAALFVAMWLDQPIASSLLALLAVAFEPKLVVSSLLLSVVSGWGVPVLLGCVLAGAAGLSLVWLRPDVWKWLWEANITLPKRMTDMRMRLMKTKDIQFMASYTREGLMYTLPWILVGIVYNRDVLYWLPAVAYLVLISIGIVIRPNHLLVLAPWIAWAGIAPELVIALVLVDWLSSGFYLGDMWRRFYPGLKNHNMEAQKIGEWLRDKAGSLWVNSYHSGIYIAARKPPVYGLVEQIEIRENVPERRDEWYRQFKTSAPGWVVVGPHPSVTFKGSGYSEQARTDAFVIFRNEKQKW